MISANSLNTSVSSQSAPIPGMSWRRMISLCNSLLPQQWIEFPYFILFRERSVFGLNQLNMLTNVSCPQWQLAGVHSVIQRIKVCVFYLKWNSSSNITEYLLKDRVIGKEDHADGERRWVATEWKKERKGEDLLWFHLLSVANNRRICSLMILTG